MKKIILTVCMAITVCTLWAQSPFSFHAKAGIGTSHLYGKSSVSETMIAYKAGAGAEYAFNKTWAVKTALEFVAIGGVDELDNGTKAKMHELYLQVPLMMSARLPLGKDFQASLSAGPYVAIGVAGKTSGEQVDMNGTTGNYIFNTNTFGSMKNGNMGNNRFDAGMALGLSFEYRRFIIGAEVQVGFIIVNMQLDQIIHPYEYENRYSPKNFASFFTVGYRF